MFRNEHLEMDIHWRMCTTCLLVNLPRPLTPTLWHQVPSWAVSNSIILMKRKVKTSLTFSVKCYPSSHLLLKPGRGTAWSCPAQAFPAQTGHVAIWTLICPVPRTGRSRTFILEGSRGSQTHSGNQPGAHLLGFKSMTFWGLTSYLQVTAYDLRAYIFLFLGALHDLPVRGAPNRPNDCISSFLRHFWGL